MCLREDNYALREVYQRLTGVPPDTLVMRRPRQDIERELMRLLGSREILEGLIKSVGDHGLTGLACQEDPLRHIVKSLLPHNRSSGNSTT
jgi:hypothetical protein